MSKRSIDNKEARRRAWHVVSKLIDQHLGSGGFGPDRNETDADAEAIRKHLDKLAQSAFERSKKP